MPDKHYLMELMSDIIPLAAAASSRFAAGIKNYSTSADIYGLVQCTQDLSTSDCDSCLRYLLKYMVKEGWRSRHVYVSSCSLEYETSPFFSLSVVPPPPSLASPTEGPASGGGGKVTVSEPGIEGEETLQISLLWHRSSANVYGQGCQ